MLELVDPIKKITTELYITYNWLNSARKYSTSGLMFGGFGICTELYAQLQNFHMSLTFSKEQIKMVLYYKQVVIRVSKNTTAYAINPESIAIIP